MYGTLIHVVCLLFSSLICLHLPSDSTSRWTPLMFSYIFPAVGQIRDFHPLECVHAGHTMLRPTSRVVALAALRWLRPGGCVAEKSPYLTPWSERSGDFRRGLRPSVWLYFLSSSRDLALSSSFFRVARYGLASLRPPRAKKDRGLSRGNDSAPGRKILAARYSPAGDSRSTLAVEALNFCVRDGNRCDCLAMVTRKRKTEENRSSENADRLAGFAASCGARRSDDYF